MVTALAGLREPIVVILLLIAFMTSISGKPLDGLLMLVAGVSLAWDAGRSRHGGTAEAGPGKTGSAGGAPAGPGPAEGLAGTARPAPERTATPETITGTMAAGAAPRMRLAGTAGGQGVTPAAARWRRRALVLAWLAGGALYVVVVGSFSRYSWPATVAVVGLGVTVVVTGWRGPRHSRPAPATLPATGLALWGVVLVAGCLWELSSLLQQPALAISSYAHPTISTLTDPVLSTWAGRSVVLAAWLGLGWFLVER